MRIPSVAVASLLAAPFTSAQGQVWVVDDDPGAGVDFADWQSAIDVASDGDLILGRAGIYPGQVVVDGKSLILVGEPGCEIVQSSATALTVRNLAADEHVALLGLGLENDFPLLLLLATGQAALVAEGNDGVVWLQDSELLGQSGVAAEESPFVVAVSSSFESAGVWEELVLPGNAPTLDPASFPPPRDAALRATDGTRLAVYDSFLVGAVGQNLGCISALEGCQNTLTGGAAAFVSDGDAYFAGCEVQGGDGEDGEAGCIIGSQTSGNGGHALAVRDLSTVDLLSTTLVAGVGGGPPPTGPQGCPDGIDGEAVEVVPPSSGGSPDVAELRGTPRAVTGDSVVRAGEPLSLTFEGEPFDLVFALVSDAPALDFDTGAVGPRAVASPWLVRTVGVLPASGELTVPVASDVLLAGEEFLATYVQGVHVTPSTAVFFGAPKALVVLGPAY